MAVAGANRLVLSGPVDREDIRAQEDADRIYSGRRPDDGNLVAAVRRGEDRAFGLLYARYRDPIRGYIMRAVGDRTRAEDLVQEVFISALRRLRATDTAILFKPWLYEIAKNACIDEWRRNQRVREVSLELDDEQAETARLFSLMQTPDVAFASKQRIDDLRGAFRGLSENHHRILVLRELEGLSYNQIGDRLGISKPVVESTLFRARRRLGEEFEEIESGRRCQRVQRMIGPSAASAGTAPAGGALGLRDRRLVARHLSHCDSCRQTARRAGIDPATGQPPAPESAVEAA